MQDKATTVAVLADRFEAAHTIIVTGHRGLSVAQLTALRRQLRPVATWTVAKNTLISRAANEARVSGLDPVLAGETALAFVTGDPAAAARTIADFGRAHPGLTIKAAVDGRTVRPEGFVRELAALGSRTAVLTRLAATLRVPLTTTARLLAAATIEGGARGGHNEH